MNDSVSGQAVKDAQHTLDRLRSSMRLTIKGKDEVIDQVLICLAAAGHPLIEDLLRLLPGLELLDTKHASPGHMCSALSMG